ncbi:MAG: HlyC/CorC family transporter [Rhodospirillales bacterium]|nr:HlyC/CorC family transporter [Alphaproteobacteria bacterium]MCB9986090.1 HlyC/CorC family transporter [Rhodospirillales bacterium]USO08630.1 MAG: HlyC/CorC family transporter [Rhodospirillales bacterium]
MEFDLKWGLWESVSAIGVLILFSAFFSAAETALTGASKARMHALELEGDARAALVNRLRENKDRLIGAILLGNNITNTLSSAIATSILMSIFGASGILYATGIITVLLLIFAEVLPKTYALMRADAMAMRVAPAVRGMIWAFSPILAVVSMILRVMLRLMKPITGQNEAAEEELRGAIELHESTEAMRTQAKRAMLHSILDLADIEVGSIMTHRKTVETVDISQPIGVVIDQVLDNAYSRLPVYRNDPDNIVGILHAKALLREMSLAQGDFSRIDISRLISDPWFIPDTTILFDQLQAFRDRKEHFAIVVDEYGTFQGIVTLEDILEEIVGDIEDEHDVSVPGVRAQPNGSYIVDGTVTIRDLNRALEWNLPDDDYATVAGLILHESKMIPAVGQSFVFHDYRFKILKRQRNQITLIRIAPDAALAQKVA